MYGCVWHSLVRSEKATASMVLYEVCYPSINSSDLNIGCIALTLETLQASEEADSAGYYCVLPCNCSVEPRNETEQQLQDI